LKEAVEAYHLKHAAQKARNMAEVKAREKTEK